MAYLRPYVGLILMALLIGGCAGNASFKNAKLGILKNEPSETVSGQFTKPQGKGPFPAVVLLHSCGGMLAHMTEDWPNFFTKHGYATLAVNTFGSRGFDRCPAAKHLAGMTMWRDAYGAWDYLASRADIDPDRIAVMGFSVGAQAVETIAGQYLKTRKNKTFRAGISMYGRCDIDGTPAFPVLEVIGEKDQYSFSCSSGPGVTAKIIKGAHHAFDQPNLRSGRVVSGNHVAVYDPAATTIAENLTLEFLKTHLRKK